MFACNREKTLRRRPHRALFQVSRNRIGKHCEFTDPSDPARAVGEHTTDTRDELVPGGPGKRTALWTLLGHCSLQFRRQFIEEDLSRRPHPGGVCSRGYRQGTTRRGSCFQFVRCRRREQFDESCPPLDGPLGPFCGRLQALSGLGDWPVSGFCSRYRRDICFRISVCHTVLSVR